MEMKETSPDIYNEVFSICLFADVFASRDFNIHHKVWVIYSGWTNRNNSCLFLLTFLQTERGMLLFTAEFLNILMLTGSVFLINWEMFPGSLNLVLPLMLLNSAIGPSLELMYIFLSATWLSHNQLWATIEVAALTNPMLIAALDTYSIVWDPKPDWAPRGNWTIILPIWNVTRHLLNPLSHSPPLSAWPDLGTQPHCEAPYELWCQNKKQHNH